MQNPLRSEAEAFRWVVAVLVGGISVVAAAKLLGSTVGLTWAFVLVCAGLWWIYRAAEAGDRSAPQTRGGDRRNRIVVIADRQLGEQVLVDEVASHLTGNRDQVLILVPVMENPDYDPDVVINDRPAEIARQRMELSMIALREKGLKPKGVLAGRDRAAALARSDESFPADHTIELE